VKGCLYDAVRINCQIDSWFLTIALTVAILNSDFLACTHGPYFLVSIDAFVSFSVGKRDLENR
jgi:hypothetical protein